jgi:S-layer family protein
LRLHVEENAAMKALVFGTLITALIAVNVVEAQVPAGGEFRVNDATASDLAFPRVAADPSGAFVVVWADDAKPAVFGRRFDPTGVPRGAEFRVNVSPVSGAQRPDVAVDATGRAVAVWSNAGAAANTTVNGLGAPLGVFGRPFDAAGRATGPEFSITSTSAYETSLAATPSGFVVAWSNDTLSDYGGGIVGRRIDVAGNPLGPEFAINNNATGFQYLPSVAAADSGAFVVAWASDDMGTEVRARRFDAGGVALARDFKVNTAPAYGAIPAVAMAADGGFVVVWTNADSVRGQRFAAAGTPLGAEFTVNSAPAPGLYPASVSSDKSGNFTVLWEAGAGGDHDVFGRRFWADGAARGGEFRVNAQTTATQSLPDVAVDGTGNLFAAWVSSHPSGTFQVFGQRVGGIVAAGMDVDDGVNGIVEVGDNFTLLTSWANVNGAAQTFDGHRSGEEVPAGLELTLSPDAAYGTVASGTAGRCTFPCFQGSLTGTRPAGHVDLGFVETLEPDAQGQAKRWRVHVGGTFADVPRSSPFYGNVETLVHHNITGGCGPSAYCPSSSTTREQMAVFVLVGKEGAGYLPPACTTPAFADMPASSRFCPWVEEVARRGASGGCGGGNFCPGVPITRQEMAVLVLRVLDPLLDPPACTTPMFDDVPASSPYCRWIEEVARLGFVVRCAGANYCPTAPVTREQMAMFIAGTFRLALYGPSIGHVPWMPSDSPPSREAQSPPPRRRR